MKQLNNPLTAEYQQLKTLVFSNSFPWFTDKSNCDEFYFYSHTFLERPEIRNYMMFPTVKSDYIGLFHEVLRQIFIHNQIDVRCVYRMNANAVEPNPNVSQITARHIDHTCPHSNMLIYLNDAGGATCTDDARHDPNEDDIVVFSGYHWHEMPKSKRRVVLVATYI